MSYPYSNDHGPVTPIIRKYAHSGPDAGTLFIAFGEELIRYRPSPALPGTEVSSACSYNGAEAIRKCMQAMVEDGTVSLGIILKVANQLDKIQAAFLGRD